MGDLFDAAAQIGRKLGGPEEFDDVRITEPEVEQQFVEILPEKQIEIRRGIIAAFLERQQLAQSPTERLVDAKLGKLINQKIGADLDDDVPMRVLLFPHTGEFAKLTPNLVVDLGYEKVEEVNPTAKASYNHIIHQLTRSHIATVGTLRDYQAAKYSFRQLRPEMFRVARIAVARPGTFFTQDEP